MTIRFAQHDDFDDFLLILREFHAESRFQNMEVDEDYFQENAQSLINNAHTDERCLLMAVDEDGTLRGFLYGGLVLYPFCRSWEAIEMYFYVRREYRNSKTGLSLITAFKTWAENRGAVELRFGVNSGINEETYAELLKKLGFRHIGSQLSYALSGEQAIRLQSAS